MCDGSIAEFDQDDPCFGVGIITSALDELGLTDQQDRDFMIVNAAPLGLTGFNSPCVKDFVDAARKRIEIRKYTLPRLTLG